MLANAVTVSPQRKANAFVAKLAMGVEGAACIARSENCNARPLTVITARNCNSGNRKDRTYMVYVARHNFRYSERCLRALYDGSSSRSRDIVVSMTQVNYTDYTL